MAVKRKRVIRNPSGRNGYVLPQAKLEQREQAFTIYRDMGQQNRSINALVIKLKKEHPEIAASLSVIFKWSKMHDWQARVDAYDDAIQQGMLRQQRQPKHVKMDVSFDQIGALLQAANQALTRAMNASPVVTKPSDVKALVDAASNALKLAETIKNQATGKISRDDIAQEMARVLDEVRRSREVDVGIMVEAELKKRGIEVEKTDGEQKEKPDVEAIEVEAVDVGPAAEPVGSGNSSDGGGARLASQGAGAGVVGMKLFADVLKTFQGGS